MRNIGVDVKKVDPVEGDSHDPFTSSFGVRGQQMVGTVMSTKMQRTATVLMERRVKIKKYKRYLWQRSKIQVHNPDSIDAQVGDVVRVMRTRPISKTKHHVIIEVLKEAGEQASAETGAVAVDVAQFEEAQKKQHKEEESEKPESESAEGPEEEPEAEPAEESESETESEESQKSEEE